MKSKEYMVTTLLNSDKLLAADKRAELNKLLGSLAERAAVSAEYVAEDTGRLKRGMRRLIIKAIGWYIRPIVQRQNDFNRDMAACLSLCRDLLEEGICE